jgi:hypothetical protein
MSEAAAPSVPTPPEQTSSSRFRLRDLLGFEKMLTPRLVRIVYFIALVIVVLAGLFQIITGLASRFAGGFIVLSGLATLILGPILVRVACEQILVIFGIFERLGEIRDQGSKT